MTPQVTKASLPQGGSETFYQSCKPKTLTVNKMHHVQAQLMRKEESLFHPRDLYQESGRVPNPNTFRPESRRASALRENANGASHLEEPADLSQDDILGGRRFKSVNVSAENSPGSPGLELHDTTNSLALVC